MPDVRSDFSRPEWVGPEAFEWVHSPEPGVERVMLDRHGDEVAVATSLVRYGAGRRFPPHEHGLGEEFVVLEGEFGDEHGRYPAGTYIRNPPGSRHSPFSHPGCLIWVKLRQFHPEDARRVVAQAYLPFPQEGSVAEELHRFRDEVVTSLAAVTGARIRFPATETVQEVLVMEGQVSSRDRVLPAHGWLRMPAGEGMELTALENTRLLHKTRPTFAIPGH